MKLLPIGLLVLTCACAVPRTYAPACTPAPVPAREAPLPTEQERKMMMEQADYGPKPNAQVLSLIAPALKVNLRDPDSLKTLALSEPYREMLWGDQPDTYQFVWRVDFQFRARNGFGGYNLQQGCADFKDGKLLSLWFDAP